MRSKMPSRRNFLAAAAVAPAIASASSPPGDSTLLEMDFRKLVSRADLTFTKPPARSEAGLPLGNGRMGSLVWMSPSALRFQINRVDVYPMNGSTNSFFERNSDYCGGCAFVDLDFGDFGEDVFPAADTGQHLSVYDALLTVKGKGVSARLLAWHERDVMAIEAEDQRPQPQGIHASLRMLRYVSQAVPGRLDALVKERIVLVKTRNHTAASQLHVRGDRIVLTQEFREGEYYAKSAVAIGIVGRKAKAGFAGETEVRLAAEPGKGPFTVLVASAASFDPKEDVVATVLGNLEAAAARRFAGLLAANQTWWHEFWSKAFVQLRSADRAADYVEQNYTYYLYLMASSSRGKFPPKFNGMIWITGGDLRTWGAQHWFANLSCYYEAVPETNRIELLDPVFDMYSGMYDASALAAEQQWGSQGIFIPETVWFDGLAKLPEDIAAEMRELYLLRKPWAERSARFMEFASTKHPHSSRWNWNGSGQWVDGRWVFKDRGAGPYGNVSHIFGTTAKVAYLYWQRYEYTLDVEWLRRRAYPMLRGAAEFYRNFPNVRKDADGKYHIYNVNSNESVWGAKDTDEDMSAMRGVFAAALRAAEILEVDADLRGGWREFLDNLAPLPVSDHPDALTPKDYAGPRVWVRGLRPVVGGRGGGPPDGNSLPLWYFDLCNLETEDAETVKTGSATFDLYFRGGVNANTRVGVLSKVAIVASLLGRAEAVRHLVPNQIRALGPERDFVDAAGTGGSGVLPNRLTLREGPQAIDAQRLGRAAHALQLALLQSVPGGPAKDPVLRVFPAWPKEWDAAYTLLARGGFLVTSSMRGGQIEFVELRSQFGGECRLRNPWGTGAVTLYRNGQRAQDLKGALLKFGTARGETVVVVRPGVTPESCRRRVAA